MRRSNGRITLFLGSMKSGKSSELFKILDHAQYRNLSYCLVRSKIDDRDFVSRKYQNDDLDYDIIFCGKLENEFCNLKKYDIICIDEGQFIEDIGPVSHTLALLGKEIYIAALNGDAEMRPWDSISNLLPFVDNIKRFSGICDECKENTTTFSYFTKKKDHQVEIGDGTYKILCRDCHNKLSKKRDELKK